jgi:hypothetical protein
VCIGEFQKQGSRRERCVRQALSSILTCDFTTSCQWLTSLATRNSTRLVPPSTSDFTPCICLHAGNEDELLYRQSSAADCLSNLLVWPTCPHAEDSTSRRLLGRKQPPPNLIIAVTEPWICERSETYLLQVCRQHRLCILPSATSLTSSLIASPPGLLSLPRGHHG